MINSSVCVHQIVAIQYLLFHYELMALYIQYFMFTLYSKHLFKLHSIDSIVKNIN